MSHVLAVEICDLFIYRIILAINQSTTILATLSSLGSVVSSITVHTTIFNPDVRHLCLVRCSPWGLYMRAVINFLVYFSDKCINKKCCHSFPLVSVIRDLPFSV